MSPTDNAALVSSLMKDLAKASAVSDFTQAYTQAKLNATASGSPQAPPPALIADADLYRAATTELVAQRAKDSAQSGFDTARQRLSAMATALYTHVDAAKPQILIDGAGINRAGLLSILLNREQELFNGAKHELDNAKQKVADAKAASDQLVAARAAAIEARSQWAATTTTTSAPAPSTTAEAVPTTPPARPKHPPRATTKAARPAPAGSTKAPASAVPLGTDPSPTILGPMALTADELSGWFASTGHAARLTVPLTELAGDYASVGAADNVRADIAFAQSILETGYFSFPAGGQLTPADNNFAGIGACDSCAHGWSFPDARTGVSAQLQLLHQYATKDPIPGPLPGLVSVAGCCQTWMALSGVWATGPGYGYHILSIYQKMLEWAVANRASSTGL